jgi:hypothetical protein
MIEKLGLGKTLVSIATMKTSVKILGASQIVARLGHRPNRPIIFYWRLQDRPITPRFLHM